MSASSRMAVLAVLAALALSVAAGAALPRMGLLPDPLQVGLGAFPFGSHPVRWRVIGLSVQRRPILAARFGDGPRKVLYVGGVHGNEYGADVAEQLAAHLDRK